MFPAILRSSLVIHGKSGALAKGLDVWKQLCLVLRAPGALHALATERDVMSRSHVATHCYFHLLSVASKIFDLFSAILTSPG